jgi:hypothetical protein
MAYEDQLSENTIVPTVSEMTQQAVKYLQVGRYTPDNCREIIAKTANILLVFV